jgi:broad specificity phosphatase PhoE
MIPDHASLRRQPLFTPIWLAAAGAFLGLIVLACATWVWATADSTTVVIVRHAEKQPDAGADPPLTPAGEARAARLVGLFGDAADPGRIDAIYVSPTARSRMTAAPLAARLGLTPLIAPGDAPAALARRVLKEHAGGRILIVAHSDTMNALVEALGGETPQPPIADAEYGRMYIVSVPRIGRVNVLRVSY